MIKYLHVIVVLCLCLFKGFIKLFCGIENPWHRSWYGDYQKHRGYDGRHHQSADGAGQGCRVYHLLAHAHRPVEKITEPEGLKAPVVEDNELNREIAPEILCEYGFRVDTAEN